MSFDSQRANLTKRPVMSTMKTTRANPKINLTIGRAWYREPEVAFGHFSALPLLGLPCIVFAESASLEKDSRRLEKQSL